MLSSKTDPAATIQTPSSDELLEAHKYIAVLEDHPTAMNTTALSDAFPDVTKQDTAHDVAELRASYETGALRSLKQRRTLLLQLQTLMTEGATLMKEALWKDLHKHPTESFATELALIMGEIQDHLDYLEDWAKPQLVATNIANLPGLSYIHKDPLGVVCIIGTWNYPVNLLFTPLISAIAAGNCAVVRLPGDDTTRFLNNVFISLFDKYMDKRFVRYVYGGVEETKAMLRERYDLIFATGGCFLGKIVARAAAEHLTPTVLELGGKSPAIVDETTDLELAARRLTWGAFTNAGQTCVRPDYVLVDARVGDKLVAAMERNLVKMYGDDARLSDCYGRVVNDRMFARLTKVLEADAALVTRGGKTDAKERYIEPTIFNFKTDLTGFTSSAVMQEEMFGPLLPIYYYEAGNLQWAIDFVTKRDKPLALYLYSTSGRNKKKVATETTSGSMVINDSMMQLSNAHLPFGGVGMSGNGAYHGRAGFDAFSHKKAVMYKYSLLDLPQRYAPYSPMSEKVLSVVLYPFSRTQFRIAKLLAFVAVIAAIAVGIRAAVKK